MEGVGPEENPGEGDKYKGAEHEKKFFNRWESGILSDYFLAIFSVALGQEQGQEPTSVQETPNDEVPACTMPKSTDQKDDKCVANRFSKAHFGAAQWDVEVVLEPRGERDVPTAPKFGDIAREIREAKIAQQFKAEEFGGTECDVWIARKVAVNLKRKSNSRQNKRGAIVVGVVRKNGVDELGNAIGNHYLFEKPPEDQAQPVKPLCIAKCACFLYLWQ